MLADHIDTVEYTQDGRDFYEFGPRRSTLVWTAGCVAHDFDLEGAQHARRLWVAQCVARNIDARFITIGEQIARQEDH